MIYTVRGPISKETLGMTLGHEHFKWEFHDEYANQMYFEKKYDDEDIEKTYDLILPILKTLHKHSCGAIVEASPPIGGQNLKLLKKLSEGSDIHIIPCTGWNVPPHIFDMFKDTFERQMANKWIKDFKEGLDTIDDVIIRPGYIKILMGKGILSEYDQAMIKAAVTACKNTGLPIHCHILEHQMVYDVIDVLENVDADFNKFLWSHADLEGHQETIKFAFDKGMWIGFDMIKVGTYEKKLEYIKTALANGHKDRLLLSQDYDFYEEVFNKGEGQECTSLLRDFIPYCEAHGVKESTIIDIMTNNPSRFYDVKTL